MAWPHPQASAYKSEAAAREVAAGGAEPLRPVGTPGRPVRIVLVTGFESFNVELYGQAAARVAQLAPNVSISVGGDGGRLLGARYALIVCVPACLVTELSDVWGSAESVLRQGWRFLGSNITRHAALTSAAHSHQLTQGLMARA